MMEAGRKPQRKKSTAGLAAQRAEDPWPGTATQHVSEGLTNSGRRSQVLRGGEEKAAHRREAASRPQSNAQREERPQEQSKRGRQHQGEPQRPWQGKVPEDEAGSSTSPQKPPSREALPTPEALGTESSPHAHPPSSRCPEMQAIRKCHSHALHCPHPGQSLQRQGDHMPRAPREEGM